MLKLWGILKGLLIQDESDRTKQLSIEVDSSATTGTRTTVKSAQTADRTLNLPDADDTLVGRQTTDNLTNKNIDADLNTITNIEDGNIKAGAAIDASKIHDGSVNNTRFGYLSNVTSDIQTQFDDLDTRVTDAETDINNLQTDLTNLQSDLTNLVLDELSNVDVPTPNDGEVLTYDDGTGKWISAAPSGANTALSNLTGPTSINADLLPSSSAINVGNISSKFGNAHFRIGNFGDSYPIRIGDANNALSILGSNIKANDSTKPITLETIGNSIADASPTENCYILTGNKVAGTGNSGNIVIQTGSSVGGLRGDVQLNGERIDATNKNIINVADPVSDQDAATKAYVDANTDGSGTGSKNYFDKESADFEDGTIGQWGARNAAVANLEYSPSQNAFNIADRFALLLPNIPAGEFIQVTEASIAVSSLSGATGTFSVSIQADDGFGNPDGTKITEIELNASVLGTTDPANKNFVFPNLPLLGGNDFWLVIDFSNTSGSPILYLDTNDTTLNNLLRWTGSAWTVQSGEAKGNVDYLEVTNSSIITLTANTTDPLAGTTDLSFAKSAASAVNDYAFLRTKIIDRADRGRPFFGYLQFDTTAANYASGDLVLEAFDVDTGALLYMGSESPVILKGQARMDFVVYTEPTTTQIEFRIKGNSTNSTAYTVFFDEFRLGPAASVSAVYRNEALINLAGSGSFTAGQIRISRTGTAVDLIVTQLLNWTSSSGPSTAAGLIPEWARPEVTAYSVALQGTSLQFEFRVTDAGAFVISVRNHSGVPTATTALGAGTLSYNVPDTSSQTLTTNELGVQTSLISLKGHDSSTHSSGSPNVISWKNIVTQSGAFSYNASTDEVTNNGFTGRVLLAANVFATHAKTTAGRRWNVGLQQDTGSGYAQIHTARGNNPTDGTGGSITVSPSYVVSTKPGDKFRVVFSNIESTDSVSLVDNLASSSFSVTALQDFTVLGAVRDFNNNQMLEVRTNATQRTVDYANDTFVPIVASGSNSNGSWVRYADGTQMCWMGITVTDQAINTPYLTVYQGTRVWTFPVPFISPPSVTCGAFRWGSGASFGSVTAPPSTTSVTFRGIDFTSRAAGTNVYISGQAIGRWK